MWLRTGNWKFVDRPWLARFFEAIEEISCTTLDAEDSAYSVDDMGISAAPSSAHEVVSRADLTKLLASEKQMSTNTACKRVSRAIKIGVFPRFPITMASAMEWISRSAPLQVRDDGIH